MCKICLAIKRPLCYAFMDLEKAFDRVPREVIRRWLWKAGVEKWLAEVAMAVYEDEQTAVRADECPSILVGLQEG